MRTKQTLVKVEKFSGNSISITGKSIFREMAVKGKKAQKQQQKPTPKLVKPPKEEEEEEEEDDDVEDEEAEEQSDEDVGEKVEEEEDDDDEEDEDDKDEEEDEDEDDDAEEKAEEVKKKEAAKDSDDASMLTTIFVGHINYQLTQKELNEFFARAGEIESSRIIPKRGYAFVTYKDPASVVEALKFDKEVLGGKAVHVERVKSKPGDNQKRKEMKRKQNKDDNESTAKKRKVDEKTGKPKRKFFGPKGGKGPGGKPQSDKKGNKPAGGKFVKPAA